MEYEEEFVESDQEQIQEPVSLESVSKADKRKQTSKANMAKARLKKLQLLKEQREAQERTYTMYDESSSESESESESDEELLITKKPKKQAKKGQKMKLPAKNEYTELQEMKTMMAQILQAQNKAKKKKVVKKQINLQLPYTPAPQKSSNQHYDNLTRQLLNL